MRGRHVFDNPILTLSGALFVGYPSERCRPHGAVRVREHEAHALIRLQRNTAAVDAYCSQHKAL